MDLPVYTEYRDTRLGLTHHDCSLDGAATLGEGVIIVLGSVQVLYNHVKFLAQPGLTKCRPKELKKC